MALLASSVSAMRGGGHGPPDSNQAKNRAVPNLDLAKLTVELSSVLAWMNLLVLVRMTAKQNADSSPGTRSSRVIVPTENFGQNRADQPDPENQGPANLANRADQDIMD